jgi:NRAMP (natural resistance-associated macrophage protein)-like metal ion transporter
MGEVKDPLLKRVPVGPDADPATDEMLKEDVEQEQETPTSAPSAGRLTLDQAKRQGPLGFLRLLGPGLVTGASDDDPSGIGTYSQVGSQFGYGMLWTALFTLPMMVAVQELCARIALQTGVGLGTSLCRKFPTWLVGVCISGLLVANTINIGADLGAIAAGGELLSRGLLKAGWLVVPAALLVLALQLYFTYATIFRIFKWLTLFLFAYLITAFVAHPNLATTLAATFVPHLEPSREFITALVAVLGTTISPYLFFWQASAEVEAERSAGKHTEWLRRGIASHELQAARIDIMVGMFFSQLIMYCIILTSAAVLHAHGKTDVQTAEQAARALEPLAGPFAFAVFALGFIGTGLLAIPILSGSASYAVREFFGFGGGLGLKFVYRPTFYVIIVVATLVGVAINLLGFDPIRALFYTAVINGVVAPPLLLLITLLGSDRKVMGEHVSGRWSKGLSWAATVSMAAAAVAMFATMVVR